MQLDAWRAIVAGNPLLASPFFAPEFALATGAARGDLSVYVADGAFFNFHRRSGNVGAPVAGQLCDYHGLIAPGQSTLSARALLKGCRLDAFDYNHAAAQPIFVKGAILRTLSPQIGLQHGFDAWRSARLEATDTIKSTERKQRKLEREIGAVEFRAHDPSPNAWVRFLEWKAADYERRGAEPVLSAPWARALLEHIRDTAGPAFSGRFSTLSAGGRLVAAHFGMRSKTHWHWWFPTYDREFNAYSPGLILLLELARAAASDGVCVIDLGRGKERYKRAFADGGAEIYEGSIEIGATLSGALRRARKISHAAAILTGSGRVIDKQRRMWNAALGSG
jgi:CelD/BcsL family acetyltransferase involved in cellulose biosynthesis